MSGKTKCATCAVAKIVFKKCAVGKNKNTEALAFGSAVCWFICPVTLCLFLSFILAVSSFRLAGNLFISLVFCQIHPYLAVYLQYMLKLYIFSQLAHRLKRNTYHSTLVRSYRLEQPLRSGDKQDATAKLPPFFSSPDGSRKPEATCLPSGRDLSG